VKTKAIIACAVVLAVLLSAILLTVYRGPSQPLTIRHVKSVQTGYLTTTMTIEITNHTADTYYFYPFNSDTDFSNPFSVQVRNGNTWTNFGGSIGQYTLARLAPRSVASYKVDVHGFQANSVVRFSVPAAKVLSGVEGCIKRAKLKLIKGDRWISWTGPVLGGRIEVVSEEWVETGK
jgi:hypothetical protein